MKTALNITRRGRGRPRKNREAPPLNELLDASAEIFARDGYSGVSLRQLQRELGVSYTLFHHYFASKEALWQAIVDRLVGNTTRRVMSALARIDDSVSELDTLRQAIRVYIRCAFESPAIFRICQQEAGQPGPRLDYLMSTYFAPSWTILKDLVAAAEAKGQIAPLPMESLFFAVQSATAPVVQQPLYQHLSGRRALKAAQIERHIEQFIGLLFNGWTRVAPATELPNNVEFQPLKITR